MIKTKINKREKEKSKLSKYGEGKTHTKASLRLGQILIDDGWEIFPNAFLSMRWYLKSETGQNLKPQQNNHEEDTIDFYHPFDMYAIKEHTNGLTSELIVEIDGSRHEKKGVKNRDKTVKEYANFLLPNALFARLDIAILINQNISDTSVLHMIKTNPHSNQTQSTKKFSSQSDKT